MSNLGPERWSPIGRRSRATWQTVATGLELKFRAGTVNSPPVIYGHINDYYLEVTCTDDREGSKPAVTRYSIEYDSGCPPIRIGEDSVLKRFPGMSRVKFISALQKGADVEIGNAKFDRIAAIDAASPDDARRFLTALRQRAITDLMETPSLRRVIVTESVTAFETKHIESSAELLVGNIIGLLRFAEIMGRPSSTTLLNSTLGDGQPRLPCYFDMPDPDELLIQDAATVD